MQSWGSYGAWLLKDGWVLTAGTGHQWGVQHRQRKQGQAALGLMVEQVVGEWRVEESIVFRCLAAQPCLEFSILRHVPGGCRDRGSPWPLLPSETSQSPAFSPSKALGQGRGTLLCFGLCTFVSYVFMVIYLDTCVFTCVLYSYSYGHTFL